MARIVGDGYSQAMAGSARIGGLPQVPVGYYITPHLGGSVMSGGSSLVTQVRDLYRNNPAGDACCGQFRPSSGSEWRGSPG